MRSLHFLKRLRGIPLHFLGLVLVTFAMTAFPMVTQAATFDQSGCQQVTYVDIGPNQPIKKIGDYGWSKDAKGCVTVRIHAKPNQEPYREQILISAGTNLTDTKPFIDPVTNEEKGRWFRLQGIPDANGNRPIITGQDATQTEMINGQPQSFPYPDNHKSDAERYLYKASTIMLWPQKNAQFAQSIVQNVMIDGLDIRGASDSYSFTDAKTGQVTHYDQFSAGIYGIAQHVILKDNIIRDNNHGVFFNSKNDSLVSLSEDLLFTGNWLEGNGRVNPNGNGDHQIHHFYTEARGVIYEHNYFGNLKPGSGGQAIKSRDSDAVFRYNVFATSPMMLNGQQASTINHFIWLTLAEGCPTLIGKDPKWKNSFIYGNTFIENGKTGGLFFSDRAPASTAYFYNNTVLLKRNHLFQEWPLFLTFKGSTVDVRNNIFASEPFQPGAAPAKFKMMPAIDPDGGIINLSANLVTPAIIQFDQWKPHVLSILNGWATNLPIPNNDNTAIFNDIATKDLHLKAGSLAINKSVALHQVVVANGYIVDKEYVDVGIFKPRANFSDLGAFASGQGAVIPPPDDGGGEVVPLLSMVSQIAASDIDTTPSFTFKTTQPGKLKYNGCPSVNPAANPANDTAVAVGNTTVTFGPLAVGIYSNCTITVTGAGNLVSAPLTVGANGTFEILAQGGNGGGVAPVLSMVSQIAASSIDTTPSFTFKTTQPGKLKYNGCPSVNPAANPANDSDVPKENTMVTFGPLAAGTYSNCTITVTGAGNLVSAPLTVGANGTFEILAQGGNNGGVAPVVTINSHIPASGNDTTPSFIFNTTEAGKLKYINCPLANPANDSDVPKENTMVTFGPLALGSYNNCSITVTGATNLVSAPLSIGNFQVVAVGVNPPVNPNANPPPNPNPNQNFAPNPFPDPSQNPAPKDIRLLDLSTPGCAGYQDLDVDNCYMYEELQALGVIKVAPMFRPNDVLNRAEALKLSEKMNEVFVEGVDYCKDVKLFNDVDPLKGHWFAQLVCYKQQKGVIQGYPGYNFLPAKLVNKAEFSKMLLRNTIFSKALADSTAKLIENNQPWYQAYMNFMTARGITTGEPDALVRRSDAVRIFYAMYKQGLMIRK